MIVYLLNFTKEDVLELFLLVVFVTFFLRNFTKGFLKIALESWPKWNLNPRPLNYVQTL